MARTAAHYTELTGDRKRARFGGLSGDVLEIGAGAGANAEFYPAGTRWVAVEPNVHMQPYLRRAAGRHGLTLEVRSGLAERIPSGADSVDAVVATLVLCSVADPALALAEVRRVLRPGGRFVFLVHVAAPSDTTLRRLQGAVRPIWRRLADGCCPDRETSAAIERAGFAEVAMDQFRLSLPITAPTSPGARSGDAGR